jgi:RNA polymerase sigma-70 factor (ECF subfamily)
MNLKSSGRNTHDSGQQEEVSLTAMCVQPGATIARRADFAVSCRQHRDAGVGTLQRERELERFLADVEKRALRIAEISIRDRDEALDLVQDAMIGLVRCYARRPAAEWTPLFYRILQNGVRDWHRRQFVRNRVIAWFGSTGGHGDDGDDRVPDPVAAAADPSGRTPDEELESHEAMAGLEAALLRLPTRQREAFMLRAFEGLDVADTAIAMRCSSGSVKTHYSRAVHSLRATLGEHWGEHRQ